MPQTYWTFKRLGVLEKMKGLSFVRKESVQFVSASGKESAPFYFADRDPNEWSKTWQVRRGEFDAMMLANAADHGAEVREGVKVREILFDESRAIGVRATVNGQDAKILSKVVIDATGQSALLSRQLNVRHPDERLRNASIYAQYRGAAIEKGRDAGATIILRTGDGQGWFWYIPLNEADGLVSVGVVAPPSHLCSGRGDDPGATLDEEIEDCEGIKKRLAGARRVGKVFVTADYSYHSKRVAGEGWVLIGDAFGFLDPVYSSGIMLALKSGEYAADAIHAGLDAGDLSGRRLGCFGPRLAEGIQNIRRLVYAFYDRGFSLGRFVREYPQHKDDVVRILIGDVFNSDVGRIFGDMGDSVALPEPIDLEESAAF